MKSRPPQVGDLVEVIGNNGYVGYTPPKIGVVVSGSKKMFMVGETLLVLIDGTVHRYLKDRLRIVTKISD